MIIRYRSSYKSRNRAVDLDLIQVKCVISLRAYSAYHYRIDLALTLANLSYTLGRSIRIDPKTERIVGDSEAAARAVPEYRAPWRFPAAYL